MNKFLQWLSSLKTRFSGTATPPPEDRDEGLSGNARALLARSTPTEDVAAQYQGTNVISRNVRELSAGNKRAETILNDLVQWSPLLNEFDGTPRDKARALTVLTTFRDLQLEGNQIGALYDLCHQSPVKMLAVLTATKDPAKVDPAAVQAAVATFGTRRVQYLPVNSILQGIVDAMPQAASGLKPDQGKDKQKGPATFKFDDLMADLKSAPRPWSSTSSVSAMSRPGAS
jgi:hypothetical protein